MKFVVGLIMCYQSTGFTGFTCRGPFSQKFSSSLFHIVIRPKDSIGKSMTRIWGDRVYIDVDGRVGFKTFPVMRVTHTAPSNSVNSELLLIY
jgi:hypothetical protein